MLRLLIVSAAVLFSFNAMAEQADIDGFNRFLDRYKSAFPMEKAAVEGL